MSVDLSNLKLVEEQIEVPDYDNYQEAQEFAPPIPEGIYTFIQGKPTFKASADGKYLNAEINHVVAGGPEDGKSLNFDRMSNKTFERSGVKVNMMADQLLALGDRLSKPRSHQEYADAIAAGEGKSFQASVQWEGGCNHEETPQACDWGALAVFRAKGAKAFPQNGNGQALTEMLCPTCGKKVSARAKINRRIAAPVGGQ